MKAFRYMIVIFAAVLFVACGNPFGTVDDEIDNGVAKTSGIDANDNESADVNLTFADAVTAPDPAVGDGFTAANGERVIIGGQWITFNAYNGTTDDYPQLHGWLYDELAAGKTIEFSQEAQNDQTGGMITYQLDDETAWVSTGGSVTVESASPLKLKFNSVKMSPYVNTLGEFTVTGTGNW